MVMLLATLVFACADTKNITYKQAPTLPKESEIKVTPRNINEIATDYVKLVLQVGQFDGDVVDAYYGPKSLKPAELASNAVYPSEKFSLQAKVLSDELALLTPALVPKDQQARLAMLKKQMVALSTKINMIGGKIYTFDEEANLLYDAQPHTIEKAYFDSLLLELSALLPGDGSVAQRYNSFMSEFVIPKDKVDSVFRAAIAEARKRTLAKIALPNNENFVLEYVTDKAWSGYNYYQGNAQSLIQINIDLPIYIGRAIDLAAHEGYPGHHVFNALLEQNLVNKKQWIEFSVYQLFSPQSLIAEGSANYGIDVAFPGDSRLEYETDVLFPLAGLDATKAALYYKVGELYATLSFAGNEAARQYLNGTISAQEAALMLQTYQLNTPEKAAQRIRFFDKYRSYVINYNLGLDLVKNYIESNGGTADNPDKRWEIFEELLSNPKTASMITR